MDKKDIKKIISSTIDEVLDRRDESITCNIGIDKDRHENEHRFIESLMGLSDRLGNIGWGFLGSAAKTFGMAIIGFICICAIAWARIEIKNLLN